MGRIQHHSPVLLLVAAFSRHESALDWARDTLCASFGPIALESERFDFSETNYYEATMGAGLKKCFFTFERFIAPERLPHIKQQTNGWEENFTAAASAAETRPLNLDPGYLTEAKLILASTKDHWHRLYLGEGIYAEQTLSFRKGGWQKLEWTYPDYQRADFQQFFTQCRDYLRSRKT